MSDVMKDPHRQKPVTMQQVAEQAGVSMSTVSRVLNASGPVDPQVAERVKAVMANLKYQPNRAARTLAGSASSALLGLVIADFQNPFTIELMRGVEEEVREHGYLLVICSVARNDTKNPHAEDRYIEVLAAAPVAGVIIVPVHERMKALEWLQERQVPIVVVDQKVRDTSIDTVRIDNVQAAKEAVSHLIANGYRRIAIITGPKTATTANERLLGYRQALHEAGLSWDAALEYRGPYTDETGERCMSQLLDSHVPFDALLTGNNMITVGAVRTLYARQMRIPEDIALVGFDEAPWVPDLVSITTVTQPAYELGRTSALRLIQRLRQPDAPRHEIVLPHRLVVRNSSIPRLKQKINPGEVSSSV